MKRILITGILGALGFALSSQAQPLPKNVLESVCGVGVYKLQNENISLDMLAKVPEKVRVMGLKAIKDYFAKNNMATKMLSAEEKAKDMNVLPQELKEAVCTVGVGTLEDNGINFETLKMIPQNIRNQGLDAIKEHLSKFKPAEMGKRAIPSGAGGYPAQIGKQVG